MSLGMTHDHAMRNKEKQILKEAILACGKRSL